MTTISNGTVTITPTLITTFSSERPSASIIHRLLSGAEVVSLTEAGHREGTLELLFDDESAAVAAESAHASPAVWVLSGSGRFGIDMSYVVGEGSIEVQLDEDTRDLWHVRVPFKRVAT